MVDLTPAQQWAIRNGFVYSGVRVWCHERETFVIVPVVEVEERPGKTKESDVPNATEQEVSSEWVAPTPDEQAAYIERLNTEYGD